MIHWLYGFEVRLVNLVLIVFFLLLSDVGAKNQGMVILMLGDSLTAGYGLPRNLSVPKVLEKKLQGDFPGLKIINGGVSGDTSAGGLSRFDWLTNTRIDLIIIELGANDGLRGLKPRVTFSNLDQILVKSKALGLKVLLTGMKAPPNFGPDYGEEFHRIYFDLCIKKSKCL